MSVYLLKRINIFLALLWIFFYFASINLNEIEYLIRFIILFFILLSLIITIILILEFSLTKKNFNFFLTFFPFFIILFFSYYDISKILIKFDIYSGIFRQIIWLSLAAVIFFSVYKTKNYKKITKIFFIFILVLFVKPTILIISMTYNNFYSINQNEKISFHNLKTKQNYKLLSSPNVYWFILDSYSRNDLLKEGFDFDNSNFTKYLESKGFVIGKFSYSNYNNTIRSISTTLNMDYYLPVNKTLYPKMWTNKLQGFNNVTKNFKEIGYKFYRAENGHYNLKTRCGGIEDWCFSGPKNSEKIISISELESQFIRLTPLYPIITRLNFNLLNIKLTNFNNVIEALKKKKKEDNFFIFAHLLTPHIPNRFDLDCKIKKKFDLNINPLKRNNFVSAYMDPNIKKGYINDIKCLNKQIKKGINDILEFDKTNPILIIQSDTGVAVTEEWKNKKEKFKIINAIRLPKKCKNDFYDSISSVNTFRLVFNCIKEKKIPLVKDRYFEIYKEKNNKGSIKEFLLN